MILTMCSPERSSKKLTNPFFKNVPPFLNEYFNLVQKLDFLSKKISEVILVGGSTYIPKVVEIVSNFTKKVPHKRISPDLVVARGAALFASSLVGKCTVPFTVRDICSHDIGVEVDGKTMSVLIPRFSTLPSNKSGQYATSSLGQTTIAVKIFEGVSALTTDNNILSCNELSGFPVSNTMKVPFEISLKVTVDGVINASVKCLTHGEWNKEIQCVTTSRGIISDEAVAASTVRMQPLLSGNQNKTLIPKLYIKKFSVVLEKALTLEESAVDSQGIKRVKEWFDANKNKCTELEVETKLTQELRIYSKAWGGTLIRLYNDTH